MCLALIRLASSINGRLSASVSNFHSDPSLLDISELCIFGLSWAIFLLCNLDQTINAFIGRLMWFGSSFFAEDAKVNP